LIPRPSAPPRPASPLRIAVGSTYNPVWNESVFVVVEDTSLSVSFEVMDWNRIEKHETVGYASIPAAELVSLALEEGGHERPVSLPIIKGGVAVNGHDHKHSQLNVRLRVIQPMPPQLMPAAVHKPVRVSRIPSLLLFLLFLFFLFLSFFLFLYLFFSFSRPS
jgi:hypothetical protein